MIDSKNKDNVLERHEIRPIFSPVACGLHLLITYYFVYFQAISPHNWYLIYGTMALQRLDRITEQDIREGYDFYRNGVDHPLIAQQRLNCYLISIRDSYGTQLPPHVVYHVDIISDDSHISILDKERHHYIERYLYPRKKLWCEYCKANTTIIGRVAWNASFYLLEGYRNRGIATIVYVLEETIYKKWGADEIQLTAVEDGRFVWRTRNFMLHCDDVGNVEKMYKEWCAENDITHVELKDIKKYPKEFLQSNWVRQFRMYKEL